MAIALIALFGGPAWAQDDIDLPEREEIAQRLETLKAVDKPDSGEQASLDTLRAVLDILDKLDDLARERAELERQLEQGPQELERLRRAANAAEDTEVPGAAALAEIPRDELEADVGEMLDRLQSLQDSLAEANSRLVAAQTLPERAQTTISESLERIEELRLARDQLPSGEAGLEAWKVQAELQLAERELAFKRRQLATNTRLHELAEQRRDVLIQQLDALQDRLDLLQAVLDQRRREKLETAITEAASRDPLIAAGHPVVTRAQTINRELSQSLIEAINRHHGYERDAIKVRTQLDRVRQVQRTLNEQIEAIRGSLLLSRILREQRGSLPAIDAHEGLQEVIADVRLEQFELGRQREALRDVEALAAQRLDDAGVEATPALLDSLSRLYQSRRDLVDELEQEYGELLTTAIDLQLNQQQLLSISRSLRATIEEQLFWVANRSPLDLGWLRKLPATLAANASPAAWQERLEAFWQPLQARALWALPVWVLAGTLVLRRRRIKQRLLVLHDEIGRLKRDTQMHTPRAIAMNALLAAPWPLALAGAGLALAEGAERAAQLLGLALLHLSLAWGVIELARRLLVSDGVAVRHFHWPGGYAACLRRLLWWLGVALVPVLLIGTLARDSGPTLAEQPIALLLLLAGLLAMSVLIARLILTHIPFFGTKVFRLLLGLSLSLVTLVLAGLIVMGYEYTALQLVGRFVVSLYILGAWILVEAAVVRGLAVAARRLAYRRAVARRRAQAQEGAEGGLEVIEEPPLDLDQVNQQSLRLSKLILFLGFALVLYLVWSDLLTALAYLDNIAVWTTEQGSGEAISQTPITIADVLTSLVTIILTSLMARNLPGLLEVMVLSRLSLKQGSAYAISSLLSYVIVGTGIVVALGTLGVSWDKLQWLVAALGVGLGFGLQEIFANFISGLIILFERPIRIGDTITLGQLHGTVSRIRIRATTVTDFDRKEIIIPNKTFVTDQLINWSLSDNITRVVLNYGVAHGSDLDTVHRLLREVAADNKRVLKDPEPQVLCTSYGSTAFNFELRIFVNDLLDRLYAADEINRRLDVLFREHGIRIAFNQMDVWLHNSDGQAAQVMSQRAAHPLGDSARPHGGPAGRGESDGEDGDS
ncbi:mechanosensitive channel MscK [Modicisalibacter radicis]|uniref:mechanosensitive channel MscK n=1 Tax=Halomonas sp. EAR18 TaxID=2518972 RepID=UPI00109C2BB4|nr:mechanosensitive channel MscK [Halomonas sp. EAR18]